MIFIYLLLSTRLLAVCDDYQTTKIAETLFVCVSFVICMCFMRLVLILFCCLGPFPPLEAALRLVHAFSECGPSNAKYVNEGTFPPLIAAIHSTDVAHHAHPQVLLSYFEISLRYVKLVDVNTLLGVVQSMVTVLRRPAANAEGVMIRNKCAYFIAKIAEAMEGKSSQLLASVGNHIAGEYEL